MKLITDYNECNYITANKEYDAILVSHKLYMITDDYGDKILVQNRVASGHLHCVGWWREV